MATATSHRGRKQATRVAENLLIALVIVIVIVWALFPIYWGFLNSIKHPGDTYGSKWIPFLQFDPTLKFWRGLLDRREVQDALKNSFIISVGAATLALVLGTL